MTSAVDDAFILRHRLSQESLQRRCGTMRTSEKVKEILRKFPGPPPPSAIVLPARLSLTPKPNNFNLEDRDLSMYTQSRSAPAPPLPPLGYVDPWSPEPSDTYQENTTDLKKNNYIKSMSVSRFWRAMSDTVQLVQLSVSAIALLLYYLIFCYMQMVYYMLRSALFFHHADGPMKVTITVVAVTSLLIIFNLVVRIEQILQAF